MWTIFNGVQNFRVRLSDESNESSVASNFSLALPTTVAPFLLATSYL